ncbi:hypothetical protein KZ686_08325 [Cupriavidus cauae]|uniref:hypothetical protein n=1 Tax=Cupriavidus TaxID=106589 RepID=UPI001CF113E5|nr:MULTISPECIES: hypothetical protein [Cupriavidus]MCA7085186.1 hypothetical protein [Cupriavidus sp. DB3]UZN47880.1 hypothetical protein KZ686_08325 [Cupriavidus cauae]
MNRRTTMLLFLAGECVLFALASVVHAGVLFAGYAHSRAATAEGVIGAVLVLGLAACLILPSRARWIAFGAQGFALLGTLVGAFAIALGFGPQTWEDKAFHAALVITLLVGIIVIRTATTSAREP